jgi:hypothetical protein
MCLGFKKNKEHASMFLCFKSGISEVLHVYMCLGLTKKKSYKNKVDLSGLMLVKKYEMAYCTVFFVWHDTTDNGIRWDNK